MKRLKFLIPAVLIVLGGVLALQVPKLTIISGYTAKNLASNVFLAGRTEASVMDNDHQVPLIKMADASYDEAEASASAQVLGLKREGPCAVMDWVAHWYQRG